jgi:hypothetical protein
VKLVRLATLVIQDPLAIPVKAVQPGTRDQLGRLGLLETLEKLGIVGLRVLLAKQVQPGSLV